MTLLQSCTLCIFAIVALCAITVPSSSTYLDFASLTNANISELFEDRANPDRRHTDHERRWYGPIPSPATQAVWDKAKCKGEKFVA